MFRNASELLQAVKFYSEIDNLYLIKEGVTVCAGGRADYNLWFRGTEESQLFIKWLKF